MKTLHSEKTEAFYQEVLKIELEMDMHSNRAHGLEQPSEELRLEAEWSADEIAYGLEIRLTDAQLADIEADVKTGCTMAEIGSDETDEAIQDVWDEALQLNAVVTIDHDDIRIVQRILEKVAEGKELDKGDRKWVGFLANVLKPSELETPLQKHARFLAHKERREERSPKEVTA
jgi:hypothetical protein